MTPADQVEIIGPGGEIRFVNLPADRGISNIGSSPENDVVIDSPDVPPFYAVLDHRQKPYQVTFLAEGPAASLRGAKPPTSEPLELNAWEQMEVAGHRIILIEGIAPLPRPTSPAGRARRAAQPPPPQRIRLASGKAAAFTERTDEYIVGKLAPREATANVQQQVNFQVTVSNGGPLEARFTVRVEGLDPAWVTIAPPHINLHDGASGTVSIYVTAPRHPSSSAGPHPFGVIITSGEYPERVCQLPGTLVLNPYYEYTVAELSPRQQTIGWARRAGETTLTITNKSNGEAPFRLAAEDDEKACRFEFRLPGETAGLIGQGELRLPAGDASAVPIRIMPIKRRLIALRSPTRSFNVSTALAEGEQVPRTVMGQVRLVPLIGPWLLLLMALSLVALLVWFIKPPAIIALDAAPDRVARPSDPVTLTYQAKRFGSQEAADRAVAGGPDDMQLATIFNRLNAAFTKPVLEFQAANGQWQEMKSTWETNSLRGQTVHTLPDPGRWQYRLRSANFISAVIPAFQAVSLPQTVLVGEVPARILSFTAVPTTTVTNGDTVILSWSVSDADSLVLQHDGLEDVFKDDELVSGQRSFTPSKDTSYTLVALNRTAPTSPDKGNITVKVVPRPVPAPEIVEFNVAPSMITAGQMVTLTWEVTGADKLSLKRANQVIADGLRPRGNLPDQPPVTTLYQIVAVKTEPDGRRSEEVTASYSVTVNLPPTPTPVPLSPEVQVFDATPKEVIAGNNQLVRLTWAVSGPTTSIEIAELNLTGLSPSGSFTFTLNATQLFVLTAANGDKKTSKGLEVKALAPTPTPSPTPPPTPPPPPPQVLFFRAESVNQAEPVTYNGTLSAQRGVPVYTLVAGSNVNLKWSTAYALKASIEGVGDQPPEGTVLLFQVSRDTVYNLVAESEDGRRATASLLLSVTPFEMPAPTRLTGWTNLPAVGQNRLTWDYDVGKRAKLLGYRIYRADLTLAGGPDFRAVALIRDPDTTQWTDEDPILQQRNPPACGLGYFVRGVYLDPTNNNAATETLSSNPSWYSSPCQ